jgi:hypothetical protein
MINSVSWYRYISTHYQTTRVKMTESYIVMSALEQKEQQFIVEHSIEKLDDLVFWKKTLREQLKEHARDSAESAHITGQLIIINRIISRMAELRNPISDVEKLSKLGELLNTAIQEIHRLEGCVISLQRQLDEERHANRTEMSLLVEKIELVREEVRINKEELQRELAVEREQKQQRTEPKWSGPKTGDPEAIQPSSFGFVHIPRNVPQPKPLTGNITTAFPHGTPRHYTPSGTTMSATIPRHHQPFPSGTTTAWGQLPEGAEELRGLLRTSSVLLTPPRCDNPVRHYRMNPPNDSPDSY